MGKPSTDEKITERTEIGGKQKGILHIDLFSNSPSSTDLETKLVELHSTILGPSPTVPLDLKSLK